MSARDRLLRRELVAPLAVFLIALLCLCALAGRERLLAPSRDNHYAHLALGWLDGRLQLEGKPPGYCTAELRRARKCRRHSYDDWATVWTLELRDGELVRGYPCKTADCQALRRQGIEAWLTLGMDHELREISSRDVVRRTDTWYVSFPPGPAVVLLPAVIARGTEARDVLWTCLIAALIPVVLLQLFDRERGTAEGRGREHLWAAAAWTFASPALFVGAHGSVWFTAQICGALFSCVYISAGWNCRKPALAGLGLALAVTCRPHLAFALPFFVLEWWRERERRLSLAVKFCAPLVVVGLAVMAHNYARFEDPLEFGHRFLDIRWQQRMQEVGMFSTDYLGRNLRCALSLLPVWRDGPWGGRLPRVSLHGSSVILGAPWLVALGLARDRCPQRLGLLLSALAVALPSLLYHNSGQIQFSYRFAVDWLPFVLTAIVFGGGARRPWFPILVVLGACWELYGAYLFARRPGQLFVTDPLGWPFEDELRSG